MNCNNLKLKTERERERTKTLACQGKVSSNKETTGRGCEHHSWPLLPHHHKELGSHFYSWMTVVPLARIKSPTFTVRDQCTIQTATQAPWYVKGLNRLLGTRHERRKARE